MSWMGKMQRISANGVFSYIYFVVSWLSAARGTFYKAREAGLCPLLPWVKRNMVQSFQFFRLHSVHGFAGSLALEKGSVAQPAALASPTHPPEWKTK